MPQATGANVIIGFGEETALGVIPGTPDGQLLYVEKMGLKKSQNRVPSKTLTASRGKARSMQGNITNDGSIDIELNPTCGLLLKHLMGNVVHSGVGPYVHTYTIGKLPTGLWIDVDNSADIASTGRYIRNLGVRIQDATFTLNNEGPCPVSFGAVGVDAVFSATPVDATLTDYGFEPFSGFDGVIEDDGVALGNVKSGSIKIGNMLESDKYAFGGAGKRRAIPEGQADVTGSIVVYFEDTTLLQKALDGVKSNLRATFTRGTGDGSLGNEFLELFVENLDYKVNTPSVDGPGGREITLEFIGFRVGAQLGLTIVVKNQIPTL